MTKYRWGIVAGGAVGVGIECFGSTPEYPFTFPGAGVFVERDGERVAAAGTGLPYPLDHLLANQAHAVNQAVCNAQ